MSRLSMLRDRLVSIKRLLASNGSIWIHLDDAEVRRSRGGRGRFVGAFG